MNRINLKFVIIFFFSIEYSNLFAQDPQTIKHELRLDLEIRPRIEFKNNFGLTPADSINPELINIQRNRLGITYLRNKFKFHTSWQEIHLFGKQHKTSAIGSINAFELYIEPSLSKKIALRIGRQGITLDNGRMFSDAPWGQQSRAHEGLRLMYKNKSLNTDLITTFTREYGKKFDAAYSPVASHRYKLLFIHYLKFKLNENYTLTTINATDIFERTDQPRNYYNRYTSGGRIEYFNKKFYATINTFYQYGKNTAQKKIHAYYIQPEISQSIAQLKIRLGAEIQSGDNTAIQNTIDHNFVPLYGVAWKFMGNMNFFTRFPADVGNSGLINPYLFLIYKISNKVSLRADEHLFYSQFGLLDKQKNTVNRYLGFENDFVLNYKHSEKLDMHLGISYYVPTESMNLLKKIESPSQIPVWVYLMISYKPISLVFKNKNKA
jgi:hypothetical protein